MPPTADRRLAPRARPPVDLRLRLVGNPEVTEIRDISASGVCCTTLQPLAVMTQVHLVLSLPGGANPGPRAALPGSVEVAADGVVVRCVRDGRRASAGTGASTAYETAIFFTGLEDADRETLAGFVVALRSSGLVA